MERQEDVGVQEVEVAAGGALGSTVAAEALEVVAAQVGSVVEVAVAEDSGEVAVVFEGHKRVSVYLRHDFAHRRNFNHTPHMKGCGFTRGMSCLCRLDPVPSRRESVDIQGIPSQVSFTTASKGERSQTGQVKSIENARNIMPV